jgi:DNA-binding transcriptional LysR family regulator
VSNSDPSRLDNRRLSVKVKGVDLDLGQVRAFVAAADEGHFGRAAARLHLSQQGLSKRIQRLEATLGEPLFERRHNLVELTSTGRRFLPSARRLLAVADETAAELRPPTSPLRIDVWGQVHAPLRLVRQLSARIPQLVPELSMRRSLAAALDALDRRDVDAACGRPYDLGRPLPAGVAVQPLYLEPFAALVVSDHPWATAASVTPDDLRASGLWWPLDNSPGELTGLLRRFATDFDVTIETGGLNLGLDHLVDAVRADPSRVALVGAEWPVPPDAGVRVVALRPVPHHLWWIVTRRDARHPSLDRLLTLVDETAEGASWLAFDPERDWLPDVDRADLLAHRRRSG